MSVKFLPTAANWSQISVAAALASVVFGPKCWASSAEQVCSDMARVGVETLRLGSAHALARRM